MDDDFVLVVIWFFGFMAGLVLTAVFLGVIAAICEGIVWLAARTPGPIGRGVVKLERYENGLPVAIVFVVLLATLVIGHTTGALWRFLRFLVDLG